MQRTTFTKTSRSSAHLAVLELFWKGREVPRLHVVAAQLNALDVLHLGELLVLADLRHVKVAVLAAVVVLELALLHAAARTTRAWWGWCLRD